MRQRISTLPLLRRLVVGRWMTADRAVELARGHMEGSLASNFPPKGIARLFFWEFFCMSRVLLAVAFFMAPLTALAEGRCPPGQYPVGSEQGVLGCAPILGGAAGTGETSAPVPTGKWETRWGAVAEDRESEPGSPTSTGAVIGQKSKRAAEALALERCERSGGRKCYVRMAYHNQCAAIADVVYSGSMAGGKSTAVSAETLEKAKSLALTQCSTLNTGAACEIAYSACSMSEFKSFR